MSTFINKAKLPLISLSNNHGLSVSLFANGAICHMTAGEIMVNQVLGSPIDGNMNNIYLRIKKGAAIQAFPLLGPTAATEASAGSLSATWRGEVSSVAYRVSLVLDPKALAWNWNVELIQKEASAITCDLIYIQDIGIANEGAVRNNEAYVSQYIDHTIFNNEGSTVIASRQNQKTSQGFSWIAQGCNLPTAGYVTDGFSFYGLSYKKTGVPEALHAKNLGSHKWQYELACAGLQTQDISLAPQKAQNILFFAHVEKDHAAATGDADLSLIKSIRAAALQRQAAPGQEQAYTALPASLFQKAPLLSGETLSASEWNTLFPGTKRHVEQQDNTLLSFFYGDHLYVAAQEKELLCERPHGHILRSGLARENSLKPGNDDILNTTNYMYGLFHSQLTIGSTSFNKVLSFTRSPLNIFKSSGQRVFVKIKGNWNLLGLASAYELGQQHARWIYKTEIGIISVTAWAAPQDTAAHLRVEHREGKSCEFIICNNLILGTNEWDNSGNIAIEGTTVRLTTGSESMLAGKYPKATFHISTATPQHVEKISTIENWPYLLIATKPCAAFTTSISGDLLSADAASTLAQTLSKQEPQWLADVQESQKSWQALTRHTTIQLGNNSDMAKINDIVAWYAHNGMIHYSTPHGLEQFTGAAWGVRDVCQGPVELFLATQNYAPVREILKMVFAQQYQHNRDWPQWFMFDRYVSIQHAESHGDIIVWPLKALSNYIEASNDVAILDDVLPYMDVKTFTHTAEKETLFGHVEKTVETIVKHFIPNTHLSCYGEGDWDDTLQPANSDMRKNMVSAWTVSLTYQTFNQLAQACTKAGKTAFAQKLQTLSAAIKKDFNQHLIKDGTAGGFAYFHPDKNVDLMLHPGDTKSGLQYRLLPMTRSMIAELFDKSQVQHHCEIIEKHLHFPDGVHLMNKPVVYKGGPRTLFRRADEAANFGREIGLQYVHAHIRYIEAMCKIGQADKAYQAILQITPIRIQDAVPNALTRQSNAYFSSSDGAFADRYEAMANFDKLKNGSVKVKGGWRIYSSGPGIFLNQIISSFFGLRFSFGDLVLDPVLPKELNGLTVRWDIANGKEAIPTEFVFHVQKSGGQIQGVRVNGKEFTDLTSNPNPYRAGGVRIAKQALLKALQPKANKVEITLG